MDRFGGHSTLFVVGQVSRRAFTIRGLKCCDESLMLVINLAHGV